MVTESGAQIAAAENGRRGATGTTAAIIAGVAIGWSLFQLWYASPLPFAFGIFILNDTEARSIHLGFAVLIAFLAFPRRRAAIQTGVPIEDWALALIGMVCAGYLYWAYRELSTRPGLPTVLDLTVSVLGLLTLLEAGRRGLGAALSTVALLFLVYNFAGPWLPGDLAHKGASITKVMSHQWLSTGGVFGVALGASTTLVFMFVLFGALLKEAGAGNYFIRLALSLVGHLSGGPAKASVIASGLTGLISGSSISNVVTTGTFTIPIMKRVGLSPEKAGAVEVAASINGQIMPPVMGAAAFLMAEYIGIPYIEICKHAALPAIIIYIALFYIVHLEAQKAGMRGLPSVGPAAPYHRLLSVSLTAAGVAIASIVAYFCLGWLKTTTGAAAAWVVAGLLLGAHVGFVFIAARSPDLPDDAATATALLEVPAFGATVRSGLHFVLPIVILLWCLLVERYSADLSVFWATCMMIVVILTQHPLTAYFRGRRDFGAAARRGARDMIAGLIAGGRGMVVVALATAISGIIVGTVSQTGVSLVLAELVEHVSGGSTILMLLMAAVATIFVGMGMPSTASYIVVATLMAPVVSTLAAENGLFLPLVAVHMFIFYFGLMADATPPVALAAYAASAIAGGDPVRTGLQGFLYESRTCMLPFMFIFNHELLLIGIQSWAHLVLTVASALLAMLTFAAATQGWFMTRSRVHESALLLLVTFSLFRPDFWMDLVYAPFVQIPPTQIERIVAALPEGGQLSLRVTGETLEGRLVEKSVMLPLGPVVDPAQRLKFGGVEIVAQADSARIGRVTFGSAAEKKGIREGWDIMSIVVPADRPAKEWVFIPVLLLLAGVFLAQRRRRAIYAPSRPRG